MDTRKRAKQSVIEGTFVWRKIMLYILTVKLGRLQSLDTLGLPLCPIYGVLVHNIDDKRLINFLKPTRK